MRCLLAIGLVVGGCFAPKPHPGAACDSDGVCPNGLVCAQASLTCELTDSVVDASIATLVDGCVPTLEICGNGIDEDCDGADLACAPNDLAAHAMDITAGGTILADTTIANDDVEQRGCGNAGGRDLFYEVTLPAGQVYYLDTFGSDITTTLRVFPGKSCDQLAAGIVPTCNRGACGGDHSQLARSLPAGTSCIVLDQDDGEMPGKAQIHVVPAGRNGNGLAGGPQTLTGNTCDGADTNHPGCTDDGKAKDVGYFMTVCPGQTRTLSASTCVNSTVTAYDTVLYVHDASAKEIACNDDTATCTPRPTRPDAADGSVLAGVSLKGPGLYWLVVDGFAGACGAYQLDTDLQ